MRGYIPFPGAPSFLGWDMSWMSKPDFLERRISSNLSKQKNLHKDWVHNLHLAACLRQKMDHIFCQNSWDLSDGSFSSKESRCSLHPWAYSQMRRSDYKLCSWEWTIENRLTFFYPSLNPCSLLIKEFSFRVALWALCGIKLHFERRSSECLTEIACIFHLERRQLPHKTGTVWDTMYSFILLYTRTRYSATDFNCSGPKEKLCTTVVSWLCVKRAMEAIMCSLAKMEPAGRGLCLTVLPHE